MLMIQYAIYMSLVLSIRFEDTNSQGEGSRTEDEDSDDEAGIVSLMFHNKNKLSVQKRSHIQKERNKKQSGKQKNMLIIVDRDKKTEQKVEKKEKNTIIIP